MIFKPSYSNDIQQGSLKKRGTGFQLGLHKLVFLHKRYLINFLNYLLKKDNINSATGIKKHQGYLYFLGIV